MLACTVALAACSELPPKQPPGSLRVTVSGLPDGVPAELLLAGPDGTALELSTSQEFPDAAAGTYQVTATDVTHFNTVFTVAEPVIRAEKQPAAGLSIRVHYAPHRDASQAAAEALNELRRAVGVPAVRLDEDGNLGHWLHAQYLAENIASTHDQDPDNEWFTPEGARAGRVSNVAFSNWTAAEDPAWPVETFIAAPFHLFSMLSPAADVMRLGRYRKPCVYTEEYPCMYDIHTLALEVQGSGSSWPDGRVVTFPGEGQLVEHGFYHGNEAPDPTAPCPGYGAGSGLPLFMMLGPGAHPGVRSTSLLRDGESLPHCVVTAESYTNDDPALETLGRSLLDGFGAVIIIPEEGLRASSSYSVTVGLRGVADIEWSFTTVIPQEEVFGGVSLAGSSVR